MKGSRTMFFLIPAVLMTLHGLREGKEKLESNYTLAELSKKAHWSLCEKLT
jgi:hypothetical protein